MLKVVGGDPAVRGRARRAASVAVIIVPAG
jgi:hypothetical protein